MKKVIAIYAIPRSGSSPMASAIAHYLSQTAGYIYLNEYFSMHFNGATYKSRRFQVDHQAWDVTGAARRQKPIFHLIEAAKRFNDLKASRDKVTLKVFSAVSLGEIHVWLNKNASGIVIRRKNHFEHMLSMLISLSTGLWYLPGGISLDPRSLVASFSNFEIFLKHHRDFDLAVEKLPNYKTAYYEDFVDLPPAEFVKTLGFTERVDWTHFKTTSKQNAKDKLSSFANADEIISWYKNSFLQERFPI